ncbi:hypothetical protein B0J12DRAFT_676923 [Macrophomina phaseolina]|uniref:Secreted protein n=1 Tax=Macrophomina phaseolina TaxID=35725 RepID=A0ABQ8G0A2_9PEZI|nr:hypothetical protein B0J12DRAFT_676923 [Macrophomina phaseolina]
MLRVIVVARPGCLVAFLAAGGRCSEAQGDVQFLNSRIAVTPAGSAAESHWASLQNSDRILIPHHLEACWPVRKRRLLGPMGFDCSDSLTALIAMIAHATRFPGEKGALHDLEERTLPCSSGAGLLQCHLTKATTAYSRTLHRSKHASKKRKVITTPLL